MASERDEVETSERPEMGRAMRRAWAIVTAAGTAAGALVAVVLFPEAMGVRGPLTEPAMHVGFSGTLGAGMGIAQAVVLDRFLRVLPVESTERSRMLLEACWVGAAVICMSWIIGSAWNVDERALVFAPWAYFSVVLPGLLALGISESFLLHGTGLSTMGWLLRTVLGGLLGTGLAVAVLIQMMMMGIDVPALLLPAAAGVLGLCVGWLQGACLDRALQGEA